MPLKEKAIIDMSIRCSVCGKEYDVTLFEFGNTVDCPCGHVVRLEHKAHLYELIYEPRFQRLQEQFRGES